MRRQSDGEAEEEENRGGVYVIMLWELLYDMRAGSAGKGAIGIGVRDSGGIFLRLMGGRTGMIIWSCCVVCFSAGDVD